MGSDLVSAEEARELLTGATPGPWAWFGNTKVKEIHLATVHSGRHFVMRFDRWGMAGAAPSFQRHMIMVRSDELVIYERPYRKDIAGIDHPDAKLIAAAPDLARTVVALSEERDALRNEARAVLRACVVPETRQIAYAGDLATYVRSCMDAVREEHAATAAGLERAVDVSADRIGEVVAERDEARRERDRLRLVLACERGEWAPEGWTAKVRGERPRWVRDGSQRPGRMIDVVHGRDREGRYGWHWWDRTIDTDGEMIDTNADGYAPTALEAIEAADRAAGEVRGG